MNFKKNIKHILGGLSGVTGLVSLYISLSESLFFEKVMAHGSQEILEHGFNQNALQFAMPLIANGTVRFLEFPIKAGLSIIGVLLIYISVSIFVNLKNPDFGLKSMFTRDYWIKFNAISYQKTKISKNTNGNRN